ncbi:aspartate aminotransferase family protein [Muricoccus radiodurans]|uniref:aspartate aminotransferase family protein n=1 Tax=Muricoccus radiodurans TaxID=2231721 RepID=UPI003CEC04B5
MPSAILHRDLRKTPTLVARGEGIYLYDEAGKRYLDASGGAAVSCLGHSHPAVIAAIEAQLKTLPFSHTSFFTNAPAEELATRLVAAAPEGFGAGRVAFVGSGSEAMEAALKLARQHFVEKGETSRSRFIARRMSYHGNTLGALAIGGHAGRRAPYAPLLMDVTHVSPCFAYRFRTEGETDAAYVARLADELDATIRDLGPQNVAAFIAEPVVGATIGCVPPLPGYFAAMRAVCDRHGVLLIADEVMCGMGRTGHLFAIAEEGVAPDLITVAKGLGAGYQPIGAVMASERVVAPLVAGSGTLQHGHTYMSHAIACAGSLAVLKAVEEEQLLGAVRQRGAELEAALRARFGDHPHVGDIRGRGLFWALELVEDRATKRPFPKAAGLAARIKAQAQANGLICYPSAGTADGENGDHVLLAPPFIIAPDGITEIVDLLDATLSQVLSSTRMAA